MRRLKINQTHNIGIKLRKLSRICPLKGYREDEVRLNAPVIVETNKGMECGRMVLFSRKDNFRESKDLKLKKVIRYANDEDLLTLKGHCQKQKTAMNVLKEKVKEYQLPIKVIDLELTFDAKRYFIYYKLKGKKSFKWHDHKGVLRELNLVLGKEVDFVEVSDREVASLIDGLGPCGLRLCCSHWQASFPRVTVKMVKKMGLSISPTRTSGMCSRLMCCLYYENENRKDKEE